MSDSVVQWLEDWESDTPTTEKEDRAAYLLQQQRQEIEALKRSSVLAREALKDQIESLKRERDELKREMEYLKDHLLQAERWIQRYENQL